MFSPFNNASIQLERVATIIQMVGLAYWAKVSEEVEAKIKEQIKNGVFPIRLKPEEWDSGDRLWLLDVVAPNRQSATAVLANFRQIADKGKVALHPVVSAVVDPEILKKMVVQVDNNTDKSKTVN